MANRACLARLRKEARAFEPPPFIRAAPLETNLQEWHYVLQGPPDSPYEGGLYHGKMKFPDDFPFKPPSIYMITPNGRFETDRRLCLSMSDFHPETWVPTWSVATILNGVLSFMVETAPTTGAIETTLATKHKLRAESVAFNARNEVFCRVFPDLIDGTLFTAVGAAAAAPAPEQPTAPAAEIERTGVGVGGEAEGAAAEDSAQQGGEGPAGAGKNAAKNKKKREKAAAAKKLGGQAGATTAAMQQLQLDATAGAPDAPAPAPAPPEEDPDATGTS